MSEGKEVTTMNFYLRNILQFLNYLQETPPRSCRLRRGQVSALTRAVNKALLARPIVTHQLTVKARKIKKIVFRASLRRCQDQARLAAIPELLSKTVFITKLYIDINACVSLQSSEIVLFLFSLSCTILISAKMETEADFNLKDDFYGYFSAFVMSIYGHRPGYSQI